MIGHLVEACALGLDDARTGKPRRRCKRFGSRRTWLVYADAYRREAAHMRARRLLPQMRLDLQTATASCGNAVAGAGPAV